MPYKATVFRLMIASPSDVEQERAIARKVIHKWNDLHSEEKEIVLLPIGWETHSYPESGDRPQSILNKQILKNADLLIGIFWTRIGTPTGEAESGTAEEIAKHIDAGKPAMLYFSNKQIAPQAIEKEQYEKVKAFKKKYSGKSLYHEFSTDEEFEKNLYEHLVLKVNTHEYFKASLDVNNADEILGVNTVRENNSIVIELSEEAKQLLIEASKSRDRTIIKLNTLQGLFVRTNNKNFVCENDPRSEATWEDTLKQLIENDFIEDKGYKGEVFAVTRKGYEFADYLTAQGENK